MTVKKVNRKAARIRRGKALTAQLSSRRAVCGYILLAGLALLTVLLFVSITPQRYDLKVGDISYNTITASKDVVDEITTARLRDEAAAAVEPTYVYKEDVAAAVMQDLNTILTQATAVQQYGAKLFSEAGDNYVFTDADMKYARSLLTGITLQDYQLSTLMRASAESIGDLRTNMTVAVRNALNTAIREKHVNETIQYVQQMVAYKTDLSLVQNVVTPILRKVIQANMVIDQDATEKLRDEARAAVDPVIYKQGQNIVLARERVTAKQLEMLRSLGLLDNDKVDVNMYIGGFLTVVLALLAMCGMLHLFNPRTLAEPKRMCIVMIAVCAAMFCCIVTKYLHVYLMPTILASMIVTSLIGAGAAISTVVATTVLMSGLIAGSDVVFSSIIPNVVLTSVVSGVTAIILIRSRPFRQRVLLSGVITAVLNAVIIVSIGCMTDTSLTDVLQNAMWSAGSAVLSAVLTIALDPLIESTFRLASPAKLQEISNPNHPLLRRLLIEASGTYHHSIIVANLAEAAAEAIGAKPLLARAGAYFHDIGKLKRPLYFKENQMGENPHDRTNPYVSAAIVTAHTHDGLQLAQQYHLPKEIQDIIIQHHGDTPVMYFYQKAVQQADGEPVDKADFRYDGKHPSSAEAAIIMMADTVEAAVRSMPDPTPDAIRQFIHKLVWGKLDDGQLDNAPLTLRDIAVICDTFATVLNGVFHERIEYPDAEKEIRKKMSALSAEKAAGSSGNTGESPADAAVPQQQPSEEQPAVSTPVEKQDEKPAESIPAEVKHE